MRTVLIIMLAIIATGCEESYTPKPLAYGRIELPPHGYIATDSSWTCPYQFEVSNQSYVTIDPKYRDKPCWYNIYYPKLNATLHLTYFSIHDDLAEQIEENRKMAMKHIAKASAIEEQLFTNDSARVYGIIYDMKGETASDLQFFLTDSVEHFLRGSLYFNVHPNKDSLDPVIKYVKEDIIHMIGSVRWAAPSETD